MVFAISKSIIDFIFDLFFSVIIVGGVYGALARQFIHERKLGGYFYYLASDENKAFWWDYFFDSPASLLMLAIVGFCVKRFCPEDASVLEKLIATFSVLIFPILLLISVTGMLILEVDVSSNLLYFHLFQITFSVVYSLIVSKAFSSEKVTSPSADHLPDDFQSSELRNCPFCYEKIQQKAIKCRFCGEMV